MSLPEFLVASGISAIVVTVVVTLIVYSARSFAAMANYASLDRASRNALDTMSKEIRQTKELTSSTANSLTFLDYDNGTLAYTYDSSARTLTRSKDGVSDATPLLTECDYLEFSIYQRNPVGGSYDVYPTATADTCKLVQLNWKCSRTILGAAINTECVQSAKIVIRKQ